MALETATELADLYEFVTRTGIVVPKIEDIKQRIENLFRDVFGSELDTTEETPVGRLIEALTVMFQTTLGVNAQNANQFNINTATGIYLDSIAQVYGIKRSIEEHTLVNVTVTTSGAGVTVPSGSLIENSATRSVFRIVNDIVVNPNETVGYGFAEAVDAGPEPADAGDINIINTGTLGWISVTNSSAISIGRFTESDADFRKRLIVSRPIGTTFLPSMRSRVSRIEGVKSCVIFENNNASSIYKNGVIILGHSLYICVLGGEDDEIARAIAETKTPGTGLTNLTIELGDENISPVTTNVSGEGLDVDVSFYRPIEIDVKVKVEADVSTYTGTDVSDDIYNAVSNAVQTTGIGDKITAAMISRELANSVPSVTVISIQVEKADSTYSPYIQMEGYEYGRLKDKDSLELKIV